jgi:hypothetical protein
MLAFRTNQPSRYVVSPAGNLMVATPNIPHIPANLKNLNTRLLANKNAWTANTSFMLNNIRRNGWNGVSRANLIKFIMYAYYGAFHLIKFNMDRNNNSEANMLRNFHRLYSQVSTRNRNNQSMITPTVLWRRLQGLSTPSLIILAKTVEW